MAWVNVTDAGAVGMVGDASLHDAPPNAWTNVSNVRFRDGYAESAYRQRRVFDPASVVPYFLLPYGTGASRFLIHAGLGAVFADNGTTRSNITGTAPTGGVDDKWTGGVLNGVAVLNNGVDQPMFWGGTGTLATLPGWNSTWRARFLRPYKNFLVAGDVTEGGTRFASMIRVSAAAVPGAVPSSWNEADPALDTLRRDLAETGDILIDALPWGDALFIYKERSAYAMTFVGGNLRFNTRRLPGEHGMLARNCAVPTPMGHVVLTGGADVVLFDGVRIQSILTGRMRRWLASNISSTIWARSFVMLNPRFNEVLVCFPTGGRQECDRALVWNWVDNTLGIRELDGWTHGAHGHLPDTASLDTYDASVLTYDAALLPYGDESTAPNDVRSVVAKASQVDLLDSGVGNNNSARIVLLERQGLTFGDSSRVKTITRIRPYFDAPQGTVVQIQVGGSMDIANSSTFGAPVNFTVGVSREANLFATGRHLAVRFRSETIAPWRLRSFDVDLVQRGRF